MAGFHVLDSQAVGMAWLDDRVQVLEQNDHLFADEAFPQLPDQPSQGPAYPPLTEIATKLADHRSSGKPLSALS